MGCIVDRSDENNDVFINFMQRSSTGLLSWPAAVHKNACWVPFQNIICCVSVPEPQGQNARFYKFAGQDTALIQKTLPSFFMRCCFVSNITSSYHLHELSTYLFINKKHY